MGGGEGWVGIEVPIWAIKERAKGEKMLREDKGERAFANGLTIESAGAKFVEEDSTALFGTKSTGNQRVDESLQCSSTYLCPRSFVG